jgi:hypothetical protein
VDDMSAADVGGPGTAHANQPRSQMERLEQQFWHYVLHFVEGEEHASHGRLLVAVALLSMFVVVSRLFEPIDELPLLDWLLPPEGLRGALPAPLAYLLELSASFFTRQTLRHALPPVLGAGLALYLGATYLRDLLELPNPSLALKYLGGTILGHDYPRLTVDEGKVIAKDPETNPILRVGGPGWADIKLGHAAIFERVMGPSAVRGAGTHYMRRFETLREVYDLREQERSKDVVRTMTRDGIPIVIKDMKARFSIKARGMRSEANPYPVMVGAIRNAAYNRKVTARGLEAWPDMVMGAVKSTITGWIAQRRMDELFPPPRTGLDDAPEAPPYRQALHDLFQQSKVRQRFADMGAEIIWVSIGHLRPDPDVDPELSPEADPAGRDKIHAQLIDTWRSTHEALAHDTLASARAYARRLSETARAQAECELIIALTDGLREARQRGTAIDDLLATRLIEYISGTRTRSSKERLRPWVALSQLVSDDTTRIDDEPAPPAPPEALPPA